MKRIGTLVFMLLTTVAQAQTPTPPVATAPPGNPVRRIEIPPPKERGEDLEDWHAELTLGYWPFLADGTVKTANAPSDLRGDLGVRGWKSHPYIRLVGKPFRRHEVIVEGTRYRLNGATHLSRSLQFRGETFAANDDLETRLKMNSLNVSYRYDVISGTRGFAGLGAGIGYLEAIAKIRSLTRDAEEHNRARAAFPIVNGAFRTFIGRGPGFNLNGEAKGMHFGNYGHYAQAALAMGISFSERFTINVGYTAMTADVHNKHESEGLKATLHGPTLSLQFRNR